MENLGGDTCPLGKSNTGHDEHEYMFEIGRLKILRLDRSREEKDNFAARYIPLG